jgi:hypothetical protein
VAHFVLSNAYLSVNGVDLSSHVRRVELTIEAATPDNTTMGSTTTQVMGGGLKNWSLNAEFLQDFAASQVDATLSNVWQQGLAVNIEVRPVNASRSATNPGYTGSAVLREYVPVSDPVGSEARATAAFVAAGPLTRSTT